MYINFDGLDIDFSKKLRDLQLEVADSQPLVVLKYGFVTLQSQAKLWRTGRSDGEIDTAISILNEAGMLYLADILTRAGYEIGEKRTNYLPGFAWNNWGEGITLEYTGTNWLGFLKKIQTLAKKYDLYVHSELGFRNTFEINNRKGEVISHYTFPEVEENMFKRYSGG